MKKIKKLKNTTNAVFSHGRTLPYWDKNVELDISSWIPYGVDYSPVSANRLHSPRLENIASLSLDQDSELIFVRSFLGGSAGTLFRDHLYDPARNSELEMGFTMVFGYSKAMENLTAQVAEKFEDLKVGLTLCGVWDRYILLDERKVLALVSENPFFDEEAFFIELEGAFEQPKTGGNLAFFAEKFGYRRFSIAHETDDTTQMSISQLLFDMTLDATRDLVGGPPGLEFPNLPGAILVGL